VYLDLAKLLDLNRVLISNANLRDGLLQEMVTENVWTEDFRNQIVRSALELGRKYHFDKKHSVHVAKLSQSLFRSLSAEHQMDHRAELILQMAALLHEIGGYINQSS